MKSLKLKTGLKAGADCSDLVQEYTEKCNERNRRGQDGGDPGFRQWGQNVGRSWANFGMSFIP